MILQRIAHACSGALGREHALIARLRPDYERLLDAVTRGRGFRRTLNGRETFFVHPAYRGLFPESYEPQVCDFLRQHVEAGSVCLNVGAHVGVYALCLARWSGPQGRVFAFEPNPETRLILESNIRRNHLESRIEVLPLAVSDSCGEAVLHAADAAGFSRLACPNPTRPERHRSLSVQVTSLDAFCEQRGIVPDWLVIDVEGFEAAVLEGSRTTLAAHHGRMGIVVEMHPQLWSASGTSRQHLESLMARYGVVPTSLDSQADPLEQNGVAFLRWR